MYKYLPFKKIPQSVLVITSGALIIVASLCFKLGSLTHRKIAGAEIAPLQAHSWNALFHDPLNAPYYLVAHLFRLTGHHGVIAMRLPSVFWALVALYFFYICLSKWLGAPKALLGSLLFITSGWILHSARLATPDIMWTASIMALLTVMATYGETLPAHSAILRLALVFAVILYIPGMVWLLAFLVFLGWKRLGEIFRASSKKLQAASWALLLVVATPLVRALILTPSLIWRWLGIDTGNLTATHLIKNLLQVPVHLFVRGPSTNVFWLPHLPVIELATLIFAVVGVYAYGILYRKRLGYLPAGLIIISWLLVGLGGIVSLSLLVPLVYILATIGIAYVLHRWLKVFPFNPIARTVGIALLSAVIFLVAVYNFRQYFIAWPHSRATEAAFTQNPS